MDVPNRKVRPGYQIPGNDQFAAFGPVCSKTIQVIRLGGVVVSEQLFHAGPTIRLYVAGPLVEQFGFPGEPFL